MPTVFFSVGPGLTPSISTYEVKSPLFRCLRISMKFHRNMKSSRCLPCMSYLRDLYQGADSREFQRPSTQCRRWMADSLPRYMNLASSFALPERASSFKILLCPKISPRYRPGPFCNGLAENTLQAQNQERYRQTASLQDRRRHIFYWQTI